jgi:myosin heavy subunit
LRGEAAGQMLTVNFRMLVLRRKYQRVRKGTIKLQGVVRGRATRKTLAAIKIQKTYRKFTAKKKYRKFKSAVTALQCKVRVIKATKLMNELKREQKDVGKLKQNNEKLKMEMASLRAMLAAQAKEGESEARNAKELQEKQDKIDKLEKRVAELEAEIEEAKKVVEKLEADIKKQAEKHSSEKDQLEQRVQYYSSKAAQTATAKRTSTVMPSSPQGKRKTVDVAELNLPPLKEGEGVSVDPEMLAQQRAHVQKLEDQLEAEKKLRREADGEIIKLRAAINGVKLNDSEVDALLGKKKGSKGPPAPSHPKVHDLVTDTRYVPYTQFLIVLRYGLAASFAVPQHDSVCMVNCSFSLNFATI